MFLKALELQGFKSFPDKTVLTFVGGMTSVVGPNGSGKSNISDAIRWVLGEQSTKSLRGAKMEDVIFSGTEQRRGVGFAEVSLVVDNTADSEGVRRLAFEHDEVKVTRRYYRSGDSEYLLNGATVRLRDVQMLFMDTGLGRDGYSIIGQGRIGDIVASKSQERREIFEEAAGISKYRYRKNEAERRLKSAEDNLLRLRDIVTELEERVGPLAAQAEKAKKFLEYASEKKELEISLWLNTLDGARETTRDLNSKLELARTQYDAAADSIDGFEAEIEGVSLAAQQLIAEMDEVRRGVQALEEDATRHDGDIAVMENDIFHNSENIERIRGEIAQFSDGGQVFEDEIAECMRDVEQKRSAIAAAERRQIEIGDEISGLSKNSDEVSGKMEELSRTAAALAVQFADIRVSAVTGRSSLEEISIRVSQLTAAQQLRTGQNENLQDEIVGVQEGFDDCNKRVEELQNAVKGYEMRWQSRAKRLEEAKEKADQLGLDAEEKRRRVKLLEDLERNMEGFAGSVKSVMKQSERGMLRGIHGPVTHLIQTKGETALAIETALGAATQNMVCDTEDDAKKAIAFLKESRSGRGTFLPLTSAKGSVLSERGLADENGFVGLAAELVTYDPKYEGVVRSLLGRIAVAEDLDYAVSIARRYGYKFRVVTLDGQVVNAGGSLTGGSSIRSAGLLSRRGEIERIQSQANELAAKAAEARELWKAAQQEAGAAEAALSGTRGELATAQEDNIRFEGELRRLREQIENGVQVVDEICGELKNLEIRAEQSRAQAEQAEAEAVSVEQRKAEVERELEGLSGGRQELTGQREVLAETLAEIKLAIVTYNKEIEAKLSIADSVKARHTEAAGRVESLEEQAVKLEKLNEDIHERIAQTAKTAAELRDRAAAELGGISLLNERRAEGEQLQTSLRKQSREKSDEREKIGREVVRLEEKAAAVERETDDLITRLYEEYEMTRMEAEAFAKPIEDKTAANRRLGELKNRIRSLGSVNVDAIEEYKEVSERYEFLSTQVRDVEISRDQLLRLIDELTVQMKEMFIERFRQINYHYGIVFTELFGGGKGELKLSDPEDILNSGIEFNIQPPGKVILNIDSLSGGEKALVAIALLFSILKVSPSPFCVLDEIEAALDDVNVDRYASYLRRMCDGIQFITITHRRGTMEEADVLYGVTMQEKGVSKLLSLRASEVEEKLGISGGKMES